MRNTDRSIYRRSSTLRAGARAKALATLANRYPDEYQAEYKKEIEALGLRLTAPKFIKSKDVA